MLVTMTPLYYELAPDATSDELLLPEVAVNFVGSTVIVNSGSPAQPRNGTPDTTQRKLMSLPLDADVIDRLQESWRWGARESGVKRDA